MRTLCLCCSEGTFVLDQMDLGDYIEVEFVRDLGHLDNYRDGTPVLALRTYELLLTFSNTNLSPELVRFTSINEPYLEGRYPGEPLRLRTCRVLSRDYHNLVVNGEAVETD